MKKLITIVFLFATLFSSGQSYVFQNNKFIKISAGYSVTSSLGELGTERNNFFSDYKISQDKLGKKTETKFLPRHTYEISSKFGLKFNPRVYLLLNVGYYRKGHKERIKYYTNGTLTNDYKMDLQMNYLVAGGHLIFFSPHNFNIYFGYDHSYNVKDKVYFNYIDHTKNSSIYDTKYFLEYYKDRRQVFLGSFVFGAGYNYKSYGIDLNFSYSRNAFMLPENELRFFSSSITLSYYFLQNRNDAIIKAEEANE